MDVDVLVVGTGPAGAAAAMTLAQRGHSVKLFGSHAARRRTFGEVMPPAAWPCLARLGAEGAFATHWHLRSWLQSSSWGSAALASRNLSFHPHGCAWHLDRKVFDADLLELACTSGVSYAPGGRLRRVTKTPAGWKVEFETLGSLEARFVVEATGRSVAFARQIGIVRRRTDRLVAMMGFYDFAETVSTAPVELLVEASENGWWYLAPLPGRRFIAAFMTDADMVPTGHGAQLEFWMSQLRQTLHAERWLGVDSRAVLQLKVAPAGTERLSVVHGDQWLAVGDAAAAFDPLSSHGLTHALDSGRLGGLAVDAALNGELRLLAAYERVVAQRADENDITRHGFYAAERRWPGSRFWARRATDAQTIGPGYEPLAATGIEQNEV